MAESVRDLKGIHRYFVDKCKICGLAVNLKVCAKCKQVAYCSKDHQIQDWPSHKGICKKICKNTLAKTSDNNFKSDLPMGDVTNSLGRLSIITQDTLEVTSAKGKGEVGGALEVDKQVELTNENTSATMRSLLVNNEFGGKRDDSTHSGAGVSNICRSKHKRQHSTDDSQTSTSGTIPRSDSTNSIGSSHSNTEFDEQELGSGSAERFILESEESTLHAPDYQKEQGNTGSQDSKMPYLSVVESRNKALSEYVIKCLNAYGLCVIDNFLGDCKGTDILDEVQDMYEGGDLASGQLVTTNSPKGAVRGDVITWVDGSEVGCGNINFLISSIDAIMLHCQKSLGNYRIKGRSKAMVAVYPGNSTHFLRHVDNPSRDGRCVTCIYYLNKNWNSKVDGGLLRIFPEGANRMANVEPKFDRLLFFWSDRRNPHEVLPAYRTRFAVTVWYYDEQERRQAVKKFKGKADSKVKDIVPLQGLSDETL